MTATPSFLYNKYPQTNWINISKYISFDSNPSWNNTKESDLGEFSLTCRKAKDEEGNVISFRNGDKIAITENQNNLTVFNGMVGRIISYEVPDVFYNLSNEDEPKLSVDFNLQIRQIDFSYIPFELIIKTPILFSELIKLIIFRNTRNSLGGVLSSGVVIEKVKLISGDTTLSGFEGKGIERELLTQACDLVGNIWNLKHFIEPNEINFIKTFQQINIKKR